MARTDWKVGDELASTDGNGNWFIHRIESITPSGLLKLGQNTTPSGLLKLGQNTLLYPTLEPRGREPWRTLSYHEVTDEIRKKVRRQLLVQRLNYASWHKLPTETLEAVHATLQRCKADAAAAGESQQEASDEATA